MHKRLPLYRMLPAVLVALVCQSSCGRTRAGSAIDSQTLLAAVRTYRGTLETPLTTANSATESPSPEGLETEGAYNLRITALFEEEKFDQLEKEAHEARVTKSRLAGGIWKIYSFYGALMVSRRGVSPDDDYKAFAKINRWIADRPESATAQIALANAYLGYAWTARGEGYANTITDERWRLFHERIELAKVPLLAASHMSEKCPYWYSLVMQVALDEGWDKSSTREILDQVILFEPLFYHVYRQYGNYLLPRWYGKEGETQAFSEEIANRLGNPEGSIVYYELASILACECGGESLQGMSWPRIRTGFNDQKRLYGTSNVKLNRFAYMSFLAFDKPSAQMAFALIGSSWDQDIWTSADKFELARVWASAP